MCRWLALLLLLPELVHARPDGQLPAYLLELPASVATVLVAETNRAALHRISNDPAGPEYADERYMSIGQNGVGKQRPWDRRTPLGIYFITEQLDTTKLHERYGPTAFPLDYPNIWDRINRRGGDGIWIHGVAENGGKRPPLDTDGCIALPNDKILALQEFLQPTVTPVIIARDVRWVGAAAIAALRGRDYVSSDDIQTLMPRVLGHRIELAPGISEMQVVIDEAMEQSIEGLARSTLRRR